VLTSIPRCFGLLYLLLLLLLLLLVLLLLLYYDNRLRSRSTADKHTMLHWTFVLGHSTRLLPCAACGAHVEVEVFRIFAIEARFGLQRSPEELDGQRQ
jgi:hypothetical protein